MTWITGCVNTAEDLGGHLPTGVASASQGGIPQRLWDRYALQDVEGNRLPYLLKDSSGVRVRVIADTLYFAVPRTSYREVAVFGRQTGSEVEQLLRVTSDSTVLYGRTSDAAVQINSLVFGPATASLSGATRVAPFSPILRLEGARATYTMF